MVICMELCKICPLKICLSSKDCDCGLRESKKSLDVKISVEGNLTVITGESVRAALQKWKKRAILKELKSKCHTNGWVDDDKAIYLKGKHEHKIIIQTLQPFFIFWFCNTCYTQKCLKYLKYVLHICQNIC
jgi:translation initiation factor 1 (eIF-1/SUI1)